MKRMKFAEAIEAVTGMFTLRDVMTGELDHVEKCIQEIGESKYAASDASKEDLHVYCTTRAALYSGLASVDEILGWVNLMTERDEQGKVLEMAKLLPPMPIWSIN